jgi:hypothetical protein
MAIPRLYWMLECTGCEARFVVFDSYLKFVGTRNPVPYDGEGYEGPPLPERHTCPRRCVHPLTAIGSIGHPSERTMWLSKPHVPVEMTEEQIQEWRLLIDEAGLSRGERATPLRPWWKIWRSAG